MRGSVIATLTLLQLTAAAPTFINGGDRNLYKQAASHEVNAARSTTESSQKGSNIPLVGNEWYTIDSSPKFHSGVEARNLPSDGFIKPKIGVPINTGDKFETAEFTQDKRMKIPFALDKTSYGGLQDLKDRSSTLKPLPIVNKTPVWDFSGLNKPVQARSTGVEDLDERSNTLELSNSKLLPTVNKTPVWDFTELPQSVQARSTEAEDLDERSNTLELSNSKLLPTVNKTPVWDFSGLNEPVQARSTGVEDLDERSSTLDLSNSKLFQTVNKTPVWDLSRINEPVQARSTGVEDLDERSNTLELSNSKLLPIVNKTPVWVD